MRPAVRSFTTSPPWERSKSKSKKATLSSPKKKANFADPGSDRLDSRSSRDLPNGKSAAQAQAQKTRRKTTKQYERFASLVLATAHDVKFKYKNKAKLAPVWTEFMRILLKAVENPRPPKDDAEEFEEFEELEQATEAENVVEEGSESETAAAQACEVEADPPEDIAETTYARGLKSTLEEAFIEGGQTELTKKLEEEFRSYAYDREFSMDVEQQKKIADLCNTTEWYPGARSLHRTIHLHVGPTNSGKTYHALKRLETAKNGFYAGPLRLLAHEVYSRFTQQGIPCALVTGDEIKIPDNQIPRIFSNTVEMAPFQELEVGVIDEIQMIGDPRRGWAWTKAVLGAQVRELHLCGEERVVPLIRTLAALTGDKIEIHRYERLNPLKAMSTSLKGKLKNLQKGDCVVAFSRFAIHGLKRDIEKATGRRAAIVYGSLPAEIRTQQASLFNDPDNDYDFLVASDAIGMGLNLSCKRIIFESVVKKLPSGFTRLTVSEIKQIGGRAGRYRVANHKSGTDQKKETNIGFVTSLESVDLPFIQQALASEPDPIHAACLIPSDHIIQQFAAHFPLGTPFSYIVQRLCSMVEVDPNFFLANTSSMWKALEIIDDISGLTVEDRILFMHAPIDGRNVQVQKVAKAFARCIAQNKSGDLIEIPEIPFDVLDRPVSGDKEYLSSLEILHRALLLYLWLSFRAGGVFTNRELATHVKELVEVKMDRALTEFSANRQLQKATSLRRQFALLKQQMQRSLHADGDTDAEALDVESFEKNLGPLDGELNDAPETAARTA
ncbi:RNA helicase [Onygenales sp. PD_10]|nr:RNA helicase [Onygenales sp. PD_10]